MLSADIDRALETIFGRRIAIVDRSPSPYRSSYELQEVKVLFADGSRATAMFKNLSPGALSQGAAMKPRFLFNPQREIEVYASILRKLQIGSAEMFGATVDPAIERYWLWLEKVPGRELYQFGGFDVWLQVARWLADFHSSPLCAPARTRLAVPSLIEYNAAFLEKWVWRAKANWGSRVNDICKLYPAVSTALDNLPKTLVHGDFYASNILVQTEPGLRVCPVDWEMAGIGTGMLDLAALISGKWTREERLSLVEAYRTGLGCSAWTDDLTAALACCQLQIAVQWLGWSADWVAPEAHAHDWLAEALELANSAPVKELAGLAKSSKFLTH